MEHDQAQIAAENGSVILGRGWASHGEQGAERG
jgi:hypothetical protein